MQSKIISKWFAILLIVPLVFALIPAKNTQADSDGIRYEDGILSWDAVDSAAKYRISAYDKSDTYQNYQITVTATSFNLREAMNKSIKCPSGTYDIDVAAERNNGLLIKRYKITIDYTAVMPRLDSTTPRFNGKKLEWNPVANADSYRVEVQVGSSPTLWYTLDHAIAETVTGTSLVIDDSFIESDLYYQATIRATSKSGYIWSVDGRSEIVTGEQLLNGYVSPIVFGGTVTLNISNPKAGDNLHATLSGVPSSIPSNKIKYTWAVSERLGASSYSLPQTVQESTSPDFVVPDNAGYVTVLVNASGYDGYIREDYKVTINGWYTRSDGDTYYYQNDAPVTGWQRIPYMVSGRTQVVWFYFDSNGVRQTGKQVIDGKTYLFATTGFLRTGWITIGNTRYYCTRDDGLVTGWKEIKNEWYYFDSTGAMQTGWVQVSGTWYYLDSEGKMLKEWQKIDGSWYYLGGNGAMRKDWQKINGVWYYLGGNGVMRTGWQQIGGVWYYFKSSGAMAANEWCEGYWLNANGSWTYKHKATWRMTNNKWWFGDETGWYAKSETLTIDGKSYTFDAKGYWIQ